MRARAHCAQGSSPFTSFISVVSVSHSALRVLARAQVHKRTRPHTAVDIYYSIQRARNQVQYICYTVYCFSVRAYGRKALQYTYKLHPCQCHAIPIHMRALHLRLQGRAPVLPEAALDRTRGSLPVCSAAASPFARSPGRQISRRASPAEPHERAPAQPQAAPAPALHAACYIPAPPPPAPRAAQRPPRGPCSSQTAPPGSTPLPHAPQASEVARHPQIASGVHFEVAQHHHLREAVGLEVHVRLSLVIVVCG